MCSEIAAAHNFSISMINTLRLMLLHSRNSLLWHNKRNTAGEAWQTRHTTARCAGFVNHNQADERLKRATRAS